MRECLLFSEHKERTTTEPTILFEKTEEMASMKRRTSRAGGKQEATAAGVEEEKKSDDVRDMLNDADAETYRKLKKRLAITKKKADEAEEELKEDSEFHNEELFDEKRWSKMRWNACFRIAAGKIEGGEARLKRWQEEPDGIEDENELQPGLCREPGLPMRNKWRYAAALNNINPNLDEEFNAWEKKFHRFHELKKSIQSYHRAQRLHDMLAVLSNTRAIENFSAAAAFRYLTEKLTNVEEKTTGKRKFSFGAAAAKNNDDDDAEQKKKLFALYVGLREDSPVEMAVKERIGNMRLQRETFRDETVIAISPTIKPKGWGKDDNLCLLFADGRVFPCPSHKSPLCNPQSSIDPQDKDITDAVVSVLRDLDTQLGAGVLARGKLAGVCCVCSHPLTDKASKERGMGKECARHNL